MDRGTRADPCVQPCLTGKERRAILPRFGQSTCPVGFLRTRRASSSANSEWFWGGAASAAALSYAVTGGLSHARTCSKSRWSTLIRCAHSDRQCNNMMSFHPSLVGPGHTAGQFRIMQIDNGPRHTNVRREAGLRLPTNEDTRKKEALPPSTIRLWVSGLAEMHTNCYFVEGMQHIRHHVTNKSYRIGDVNCLGGISRSSVGRGSDRDMARHSWARQSVHPVYRVLMYAVHERAIPQRLQIRCALPGHSSLHGTESAQTPSHRTSFPFKKPEETVKGAHMREPTTPGSDPNNFVCLSFSVTISSSDWLRDLMHL